jgi:eukaryotic-like serine/threonine-protein kinase
MDSESTRTFLAMACQESLITPEVAGQVSREAETLHQPVSEVLVQKGVMDQVEIDIVETLLQKDQVFPGYEVLDVLGRGGMGVVYRARQKNLNRPVAIKTVLMSLVTTPGALARFEKEAVTVAGVRHPNIVAAYDFGRQNNRLFFVMELLEGQDLHTYIEKRGKLDEATAWGLARQAAWGLAHAAELGIVHRDIKPGNLLLVKPPAGFELPAGLPMVKITDFGLVLLEHDIQNTRLTRAGASLGTPAYMAPEQFSNSGVDFRADIYALGATVYHMLTGKMPFAGETVWQIMSQKMKGELGDLAAIASPESVGLLREMMAEDPKNRIGSYPELLRRIEGLPEVRRVGAASGVAAAPSPPSPRPRRRRRIQILLAVLSAVVALAVFAEIVLRPDSAETQRLAPQALATVNSRPLFDGETLNGWQTVEGLWSPARDEEKGAVLSGRGAILHPLIPPPPPDYRLSMGVDLKQASAVELHFGFHERTGEEQPRSVLRVSREGVSLGTVRSDGGALQSASSAIPFPKSSEDSSPYRELSVERQGNTWFAFFNGRLVGKLQAVAGQELPEFRLVTEGGPALFESIVLSELGPPEADR